VVTTKVYRQQEVIQVKRIGRQTISAFLIIFMLMSLAPQVAAITSTSSPTLPTWPSARSASYNSIRISWAASSYATGYYIWRASTSAGPYSKITTILSATTTSYTNSSLVTGKVWYYKVQAYRKTTTSTLVSERTAAVSAKALPAAATGLAVIQTTASSLKLSWNTVAGANGYSIYRSTESAGTYSLIGATSSNIYSNSGLTSGRTYYYKIRAYRIVNSSTIRGFNSKITSGKPTLNAGAFPAKDYGTVFRDDFGLNSQVLASGVSGLTIDLGKTANGVVLLKISSSTVDSSLKCKAILSANGKMYQYDIVKRDTFVGLPLQFEEGTYTLSIYKQIQDTNYSTLTSKSFTVNLDSTLSPYTAASIIADFASYSPCVVKANSLCSGKTTTDGKVDAVYRWIMANITYNRTLASQITAGQVTTYLPSPDKTYANKIGICFDYASLMCAMLRSQGIPTRLIKGMTPYGYHAWNEVYFEGRGWVVVASFQWYNVSSTAWGMFDSTFAAGGLTSKQILDTTHTKYYFY
jgi:transglutaminase-like putative cysteine protease